MGGAACALQIMPMLLIHSIRWLSDWALNTAGKFVDNANKMAEYSEFQEETILFSFSLFQSKCFLFWGEVFLTLGASLNRLLRWLHQHFVD